MSSNTSSKHIRVNQLAKELGVESKSILAKCREEGLGEKVPNHMSVVSIGLAETIRIWFGRSGSEAGKRPVTKEPSEVEYMDIADLHRRALALQAKGDETRRLTHSTRLLAGRRPSLPPPGVYFESGPIESSDEEAAASALNAEGDDCHDGKMRNDYLVEAYRSRGERDAFDPKEVGRRVGMEAIEASDLTYKLKAQELVVMLEQGWALTDRALREAVRVMRQRGVLNGPRAADSNRDVPASSAAQSSGAKIINNGNLYYNEGHGKQTVAAGAHSHVEQPREPQNWFFKAFVNRTMAVMGSLLVAAVSYLIWYLKHKN